MNDRLRLQRIADSMEMDAHVVLVKKRNINSASYGMKLLSAFCKAVEMEEDQIIGGYSKGRRAKQYKTIFISILYFDFLFMQKDIAEIVNIDRTTVVYHVELHRQYVAKNKIYRDAYLEAIELMTMIFNETNEPK